MTSAFIVAKIGKFGEGCMPDHRSETSSTLPFIPAVNPDIVDLSTKQLKKAQEIAEELGLLKECASDKCKPIPRTDKRTKKQNERNRPLLKAVASGATGVNVTETSGVKFEFIRKGR